MIITMLEAKIAEYSNKIAALEAQGLYGMIPENRAMLKYLCNELSRVVCK